MRIAAQPVDKPPGQAAHARLTAAVPVATNGKSRVPESHDRVTMGSEPGRPRDEPTNEGL